MTEKNEELKEKVAIELNQILPTNNMTTLQREEYCLKFADKILNIDIIKQAIEDAEDEEHQKARDA